MTASSVVTFANGPVEHVAIFRNPQFDDSGWEDHPTMTAPLGAFGLHTIPQPIPHLQVRTPPQVRAGGALELTFANETAFPDGAFRVVRLDLETPAGHPYGLCFCGP